MKRAMIVSAVLCIAVAAYGEALSPADREAGVKYLEKTRDGVIEATKGLSDAQWKFKAGPDRWSIAETLEHIALAEDFIFGVDTDQVMKAPAGAADRDYKKIDAMVIAMIPDRSHKAQAPPPLVPTGRWSPSETLDHFLKSRARTIEYIRTAEGLRDHVVTKDPLNQPMDGYEFLLFISAHSERHTKQILEVKADPNFPKK